MSKKPYGFVHFDDKPSRPRSKHPSYPKVKVTWYDAVSSSAWISHKQLPKPVKVTTTGYLTKETKSHIVICGSFTHERKHDVGDCIAIPKGWIKKRKVLCP